MTLPFLDDISGTIRGYRIFTACRTVNGKIFRLEDHLERLYQSAASIYMKPPMEAVELAALLSDLTAANLNKYPGVDLLLDIVFSGGLLGSTMQQSGNGAHLYVAVQELVPPPPEAYSNGVALATFPHQRPWADVKLLNYVGAILAHQTVVPANDAWDALFVDPADGRTLLEGSTFTVFFVDARGEVVTPPLDGRILHSITRRVTFEILLGQEWPVLRESPVTIDMLPSFAEAFLCSTTRNILPLNRIDRHVIGNGSPGPVTKHIMKLFDEYIRSY
ncbi:MAG: aminotransferase class IV [Pseudomonadota bacterium]